MGTDEVLPRHGARYNCRSILRRTSILDPQRESPSRTRAPPTRRHPNGGPATIYTYIRWRFVSAAGKEMAWGEREREMRNGEMALSTTTTLCHATIFIARPPRPRGGLALDISSPHLVRPELRHLDGRVPVGHAPARVDRLGDERRHHRRIAAVRRVEEGGARAPPFGQSRRGARARAPAHPQCRCFGMMRTRARDPCF